MEFFIEINNKKLKFTQHINLKNLDYFVPLLSREFNSQLLFLLIDLNTLYTFEETEINSTVKFNFSEGEFKEFNKSDFPKITKIKSIIEFTGNCFLNKYLANYGKIQEFNRLFWNALSNTDFSSNNYVILPGVVGLLF